MRISDIWETMPIYNKYSNAVSEYVNTSTIDPEIEAGLK